MIKQRGFQDYQEMDFSICSYAWMSLTWSWSFPHGVASGGFHQRSTPPPLLNELNVKLELSPWCSKRGFSSEVQPPPPPKKKKKSSYLHISYTIKQKIVKFYHFCWIGRIKLKKF